MRLHPALHDAIEAAFRAAAGSSAELRRLIGPPGKGG